jgi:hypothetical protein
MSETRIEIVVSGDNAEATLEQLVAQLPEDARVVAASDGQAAMSEAFEQALGAAGDLPARVAEWWHAAQAGDGAGPVLALLLSAVIFAAAYGVECAGVALLARRAGSTSAPGQDYSDRVRAATRWGLWQVLRLVLFFCHLPRGCRGRGGFRDRHGRPRPGVARRCHALPDPDNAGPISYRGW